MGTFKYGLDLDFLDSLENRLSVDSLLSGYQSEVKGKKIEEKDSTAKKYFAKTGEDFAEMICLEEGEHRDRMAETIYEIAEKTGHIFPSVPQRLFEISMNAMRPGDEWIYREVSKNAIVYEVKKCEIYDKLSKTAGEKETKKMPCWNFCRCLSDTIYSKTGVRVKVTMEKSLAEDHRCVVRAECYS